MEHPKAVSAITMEKVDAKEHKMNATSNINATPARQGLTTNMTWSSVQ